MLTHPGAGETRWPGGSPTQSCELAAAVCLHGCCCLILTVIIHLHQLFHKPQNAYLAH